MNKFLHFTKIMIVLFLVSNAAFGQYTGSYPNVAEFKVTLAMDSIAGFEPSKAVDASLATYCSLSGDAPVWLQVDLGTYYFIDGYGLILPNVDELPTAYTIQGSRNGSFFFDINQGTATTTDPISEDLTWPDNYRYVRINITEKDALASISEFYVYGIETVPPTAPMNKEASNITDTGFTASWTSRVNATGYIVDVANDIYFDDPVAGYENLDVGNVLSWDVTGLSPQTTYYQRVSAYNVSGTSSPSNYISVTTLVQSQNITFEAIPPKSYGDADFDLTATASSGLPVSYLSTDETVATVNGSTVTIVGVGNTDIIASQAGDANYQAAEPVAQDLEVLPKELTASGLTAEDKTYDGTDAATLSGASLDGVVGTELVVLEGATGGTFAQSDVGTGITVTTAMTLSGADAANYSILQPTDLSADITPKELTVTGAEADDKVYDGTTDATITGGDLEGVIGTEIVNLTNANTAIFSSSAAGTGITVTTAMTLSGADADNYELVQPALSADITPKDLIVTPEDKSREACKPNPDFTLNYSGFVGTEDVTALIAEPVGATTADAASAPGTYDITVSGGDGGNYNLFFANGTLTVIPDVTSPLLGVQNFTARLDNSGNASITPADVVLVASDDCGVVDTTLSQSTFTSAEAGDITIDVTVTDEAGNSTTEPVVITVQDPTGLSVLSGSSVNIYPNPTSDQVHLDLNIRAERLKVMDMTGKAIISRSNLRTSEAVDLSGFSNGIYIFQLQLGEEIMHIKVIKK